MEQITNTPNFGNLYVEDSSVIAIDVFITENALKLKPTGDREDWTEELCWLRQKIRFFGTGKLTHLRNMIENKGKLGDVMSKVYN